MKKLNFGCGSIQPEDWINLDNDPEFNAPHTHINEFGYREFDYIVAHCALQTNDIKELPALLKQLYDILIVDGMLRISLPDIEKGFEKLKAGEIDWFPNGESNIDDRFSHWITWYSTTRTLLTPNALINMLKDAGFRMVERVNYKDSIRDNYKEILTELDTRNNECYFVDAIK